MLVSIVIIIALVAVVLLAFSDKFAVANAPRERSTDKHNAWLLWGTPIVLVALGLGIYALLANRGTEGTARQSSAAMPTMQTSTMPQQSATGMPTSAAQSNKGGDLSVAVKHLAGKLEKDPKNGEGWALLAHTHVELRQYAEAENAFVKAAALLPADAKILADWADAHVMGKGGKWDNEARDLVKRALAAEPKNLKALALAGSEAYARADYPKAIAFWKDMLAAAPAGSIHAKLAQANIDEANAVLSGKKSAQ